MDIVIIIAENVKLPTVLLNESNFLSVVKCLDNKSFIVKATAVHIAIITGTHEATCYSF